MLLMALVVPGWRGIECEVTDVNERRLWPGERKAPRKWQTVADLSRAERNGGGGGGEGKRGTTGGERRARARAITRHDRAEHLVARGEPEIPARRKAVLKGRSLPLPHSLPPPAAAAAVCRGFLRGLVFIAVMQNGNEVGHLTT